jgi:aminopeptidase N
MSSDADAFNRWEAGQTLATELLLDMTNTAKAGHIPQVDDTYLGAIGEALARAKDDHAFAAQMLVPPVESELALRMTPADPEAIHFARLALIRSVLLAHGTRIESLYRELDAGGTFSPDAASAGRRALRNTLLRYLTCADDEDAAALAQTHYRAATNMTDGIAGLAALSRIDSPRTTEAFTHFHDRFKSDPLVLDKWMGLQAGSPLPGTAARVTSLMNHPAFDIRNPNRVRALVGVFAGNHLRFNAADGAGYRLVGETVRALDSINPQVAARMAGAFENWRRYDNHRQNLMRHELEAMLKRPGASPNMFEVASKMLG